jgi:hypothetical protein
MAGKSSKQRVQLKVNLKDGPGGIILRKGRVFEGKLEDMPMSIQRAIDDKSTKILHFLGDTTEPLVISNEVPDFAKKSIRAGIKPLETKPVKRETPKTVEPNRPSHEADSVITPPVKPRVRQLKERGE